MVIDYKDISFSFDARRRKRRRRQVALVALLIVTAILFSLWISHRQANRLRRIEDHLLEGRLAEAQDLRAEASGSLFHKRHLGEVSALVDLFSGNAKAARKGLASLEGAATPVRHDSFLSRLAEQAEYLKLEIYLEYLSRTERTSHFYSALAQAALFRPTESRKVMKAMAGPELRDNAKAVALITAANDRIQTGKIHYIFDANGEPLAHYDVKLGRTVSEAPGLSFTSFTPSLQHGLRYYTLTIDLRIQKIIARVFAKYSGSMLVLDLEDGGIAAAYSKPTAAPMENPVFERQYEPGSTMKVITLYGYLADEGQSCYPVECRGLINLGDRVFYDRLPHGIIETPQKALAVSCNIAFAKMGLKLGLKKMTGTYELFMFNAPPLTDEFLKFHLGRIDSAADHGYRLANLSVGLNEVSVTTFHSALIPALVAQQGSVYKPHMIKTIKNVLNLGFYNHAAETLETRGLPRLHAEIQKAMIAVVENPSGTGRRARVEFMRTAVKTGTAGEKSAGFDAVMIGFFPAKYPRYAFAFRLQGGGKAEFNAAYLLKSFLTEWRGIGTDD